MAIATINPATGQIIKTFEALTDAEVDKKIQLAGEVFPAFRNLSFAERAKMMLKAADILEAEKEPLGRLMTIEMGKTYRSAVDEGAAAITPKTRNDFSPTSSSRPRPAAATSDISRWGSSWSSCPGIIPSGRSSASLRRD
jgi:hypothetical protein